MMFEAWIRKTFVPGAAPACVGAVAWVLLDLVIKPDNWLELIWCTGGGLLCYMAVLLGCCLEAQDKRDLTTVLTKVRDAIGRRPRVLGKRPANAGDASEIGSDAEGPAALK